MRKIKSKKGYDEFKKEVDDKVKRAGTKVQAVVRIASTVKNEGADLVTEAVTEAKDEDADLENGDHVEKDQ